MIRAPLAPRGEALLRDEHETGGRVRVAHVRREPVGVARRQRVTAPDDDEARGRHERQRLRGLDDRVDLGHLAVEHLAPRGARARVGQEPARHGRERVVEELHVGPVEEDDRRDLALLDPREEARVVQR